MKNKEQFDKCTNKVDVQKYLQDFDGICYDCSIENSLLFKECVKHQIKGETNV
jgi:hypothetical protein